jgi:hypothetical protein
MVLRLPVGFKIDTILDVPLLVKIVELDCDLCDFLGKNACVRLKWVEVKVCQGWSDERFELPG